MADDVEFTEMDHSDWLRQWDRVDSGELRYQLREVAREMGVDLDDISDMLRDLRGEANRDMLGDEPWPCPTH